MKSQDTSRPPRLVRAAFVVLAAQFVLPALSYAIAPQLAVESFDRVNRLLGGSAYLAQEGAGHLWHMLAVGNVMTLGFMCLLLAWDLRRFFVVIVPLAFLKGFSAAYSLFLAFAEGVPAFAAVFVLDAVTTGVMVALAVWGRRALSAVAAVGAAAALACAPAEPPQVDPGRVTLHRLNRAEYDNTVRDLLGTGLSPARGFPEDDHGHGFDNNADVLSLSPLQVELYADAARALAHAAVRAAPSVRYEAEEVGAGGGARYRDVGWRLFDAGRLTLSHDVGAAGRYRVRVRAFGDAADGVAPALALHVAGVQVAQASVEAPAEFFADVELPEGAARIELSLLNPHRASTGALRAGIVDWVRLEGPLGEDAPGSALLTCTPQGDDVAQCATQVLSPLVRAAWRRPVSDDELSVLVGLVRTAWDEGASFEEGIELAVEAVLLSPHFLFRVELDPEPTSTEPHPIDDHALASRLSYFLWSTQPDERLRKLADEGKLADPLTLWAEVERMLADPKSRALTDNFAGQWLFTRALHSAAPDPELFPAFDEPLRSSMEEEARRFFEEFLHSDRPARGMLDADFTWVDARLARHYGIDTAPEQGFARVPTGGTARRGLLSLGSVLTTTSYPTRTSVVLRGKWVLRQLLCDEPPAPPPGVAGLKEERVPTATLRERMEQHRKSPVCASCHSMMDPIGFGLESFDGIGQHRTHEAGAVIDTSGMLPDGASFQDSRGLAAALASHPKLDACFARQLYVYALGRGVEPLDEPLLDDIVTSANAEGASFKALIHAIVQAPSFRMRRGEPEGEVTP